MRKPKSGDQDRVYLNFNFYQGFPETLHVCSNASLYVSDVKRLAARLRKFAKYMEYREKKLKKRVK